ncbi:MAG: MFS transporter [Proteobacteria bacterium]|nr:MAG: MFS transporter [Pseudomonadota bacterium]
MSVADSPIGKTILLRLFVPFALGYFLSYLFRVVNAVIAPDLTRELGLSPADLGLLTSAYFLTFAMFQLPLGVMLDRMGPRRIEGILLLFAGAGALIFALSESTLGLVIGRGLIGFGVSACLMAPFKAFVDWLPANRLPLANGVQMAAGGLGALSATAPVQVLLQVTDWRGLFLLLAALSVIVAAVVWFVVPDRPEEPPKSSLRGQIRGVAQVFTSAAFWRIAPLAVLAQASFHSIQSLWAGPWLRDIAGMERGDAANVLFLIAAAMVAGFITWGAFTMRLNRRGIRTATVAATGMSLFICVQIMLLFLPVAWTVPLWMLFGFMGTTGILSYAALSQAFPRALAGRVNTAVNLLVFVVAFVAQWGMGGVIGLWPVRPGGGYEPAAYHASFGMMIVLQLTMALWYWWSVFRERRGT